MSKDKPRSRFITWTGGLNTQDEPYLINEDEYSDCENMVLETGVPQTRLGSAKFDATNTGEKEIRGLGEYLYYDTSGDLTRYLLAADAAKLRIWAYSGGSWSYQLDTSAVMSTQSGEAYFTSMTNFKNKMLITNGEDAPREFDASVSTTNTNPLGIKPPNRILLIADFPYTAADDDDRVAVAYDYNGSATSDKCVSTGPGVIKWKRRINNTDLEGNDYAMLLSENEDNTTVSETIQFDSALDMEDFSDTDSDYSDELDLFCFSAHIIPGSWDYLDNITVSVDMENGDFSGQYVRYVITKVDLDGNDWGGFKGGQYDIKLSKYKFRWDRVNFENDEQPDWGAVYAIKFAVTTAGNDNNVDNDTSVNVYIDYLRMEESSAIPAALGRVIDPMESFSGWTHWGGGGVTATASQVRYGMHSLVAGVGGSFFCLKNDYATPLDLAHWENGVEVRKSDCISFDIYFDTETPVTGALFTIRLYSGTAWDRWVGVTKRHNGTNSGLSYGTSRAVMPGAYTPNKWHRVFIPIGWIVDTDTTNMIGEFINSNHGWSTWNNKDHYLNSWEPSEVMSKVSRIAIGGVVTGSAGNLYVDNLQLVPFPVWKPIAHFAGYRLSEDIPLAGIWEVVENFVEDRPILGLIANTLERLGVELPQELHIERSIGESWTVSGVTDWSFDYVDKQSLASSLRLDIGPSSIATATIDWNGLRGNTRDLTDFGREGIAARPVFQNNGVTFDGIVSDDVDVIRFKVMIDRITAVSKVQLIFTIDAAGNNYYVFDLIPEDFGYSRGKIKRKNRTRDSDLRQTAEVIADPLFGLGDEIIGVLEQVTVSGMLLEGKGVGEDLEQMYRAEVRGGDHQWHEIKIPKRDFTKVGSDTTVDWSTVYSMSLTVYTVPLVGCTCWFDKMILVNEGALKGDYYYKVVYRTKDNQSYPSLSSPRGEATGTDILLSSIPVSDDSRVVWKDIYRMGGSVSGWRHLTTLANADTTYLDHTPDDELGIELDDQFGLPPVAKYGIEHNNRYWMANSKSKPSRLFYSRPFRSGAFPYTNFIDIAPSAYGEITGLAKTQNGLIVFKNNAIYKIVETTKGGGSYYWFEDISTSIGCDAPRSITNHNGIIYFIWRNKPYRLYGNRIDDAIGDKVENLFAYSDGGSVDYVNNTASSCYHDNKILFAIKSGSGSTFNDKVISYNTKYECWEAKHFGTGWSVNNMVTMMDGKLYAGSSTELTADQNDYLIWELFKASTYSDNTVAIAAKLVTRYLAGLEKHLGGQRLWFTAKKAAGTFSSDTMTARPVLDYTLDESGEGGEITTASDSFSLANVSRPQSDSMPIRAQDIGTFLGFQFACSNDTGVWKFLMAVLEYIAEDK